MRFRPPPGTVCITSFKLAKPGFKEVFGAPIFDYIQAHPEISPIFDAGHVLLETAAMLDSYDSSGINALADIGGVNGSLISPLLAITSSSSSPTTRTSM
jgi:hypothetical protein